MSSTLTSAERRALKSRAQRLDTTVRLGHSGVTEAWLKSLDTELMVHELVKVRFTDQKADRKQLAPEIAEKSGSELVTLVGNVAVLFRKRPEQPPVDEVDRIPSPS